MATAGPVRGAILAALAAVACAGCGGVGRRMVIESNVPNAQVYIDDRPVGPAPAHSSFEYYGHYKITLVHPGYETSVNRVHVIAPWYAYPPFDFLAGFWPFGVQDVRRYYFELCPAQPTRTDELIGRADALRARGWALPPPPEPAEPAGGVPGVPPPGSPAPPPGAQPLPAPAPVPGGAPGMPPGPSAPASPLVPSVLPMGGAVTGPGTFAR
jgi:hypothetical protein